MTMPEIYYQDPAVRIYSGDCLDVMRSMPSGSVDLIVTDPPYGMGYVSARRKHSNDVTVPIVNDEEFDPGFNWAWIREAHRVMKDNTHIYLFCSDHHLGRFREIVGHYFDIKRLLVWVKDNHSSGDLEGDYGHKTEFILFAHKGRRKLNGARLPNVLEYPRVNNLLHSCQKPEPLIGLLIEKSSKPGEVVFDPFLGSGTTAKEAKRLGRKGWGVEVVDTYLKIAADRCRQDSLFDGLMA